MIFHSATLLDKLGFNFRMVRERGKRTGDHRPFDEDSLEDYFARLTPLAVTVVRGSLQITGDVIT